MSLQSQIRPSVRNDDWGRNVVTHLKRPVAHYTEGEKRRISLLTELMILTWKDKAKAEGHNKPKRNDYSAARELTFEAILEHPGITVNQIAEVIGKSTKSCDNAIQSLRKAKMVKRTGEKKSFKYTALVTEYYVTPPANSDDSTARRKKLLDDMPEEISINDAAALMGVSRATAREDLNSMRVAGVLVKKRVQHYSIYSRAEPGETQ